MWVEEAQRNERAFAYITAAWSGNPCEATDQAAKYCRAVYEAGFSPICPAFYQSLFLNDAVPEEHKDSYGMIDVVVIGTICLMFGLTTSTGWYVYYCSMISHAFHKNLARQEKVLYVFKRIYPWLSLIWLVLLVYFNASPSALWAIKDIVTVFPTFFNVVAMLLLSDVFVKLLKDYKARYMGIGKVDPDLAVF